MIPTRPPASPASASLSRSLRKERAKLGLETTHSPTHLHHHNNNNNHHNSLEDTLSLSFSRQHTSSTTPPTNLNQHLPNLLLFSSSAPHPDRARKQRTRTPALLRVPLVTDQLGLNLMRLAEQNNKSMASSHTVQDNWSVHSYKRTADQEQRPELSPAFSSVSSVSRFSSGASSPLPPELSSSPTIAPYFAKNGNVEHLRHVSTEVLHALREGLQTYQYKPNNNIDVPPPGAVTRLCFESLSKMAAAMAGPIQTLLLQANAILKQVAFVDPTFIRERLIPMGIVAATPAAAAASSTPVVDSISMNHSVPSSPHSLPSLHQLLLHTEAVVLLQQHTLHTIAREEEWQHKEEQSQHHLLSMQEQVEVLSKKEFLLRQQLTQLLRKEGSAVVERNVLIQKEKKLKTDIKHAKMMAVEVDREEHSLTTRRLYLEEEYTNVREELMLEGKWC